ncbi:MinD/ParA family protein [Mycobacterium sp. 3519A]|uniref:MinD/ParA family ATP-binding protein n=1 Tax=Mycobacterium sp. 3519A TaxID=2057184 RepID=UPI00351426FA
MSKHSDTGHDGHPDRGPAEIDHDTPPPPSGVPIAPALTDFTGEQPSHYLQYGRRTPAAAELGLVRSTTAAPRRGWRKALHRLTAGTLNVGESTAQAAEQVLIERINRPVRGSFSIAVLSLKGGVGKTTTTVGLGTAFSSLRGDRVIAIDANPDFGTLAQRGPNQTRSTVRDLLADGHLVRYSDVRRHTSQGASRLEFVASERDPAVSEAFSEEDYRAVHKILDRFYNIILIDCGTGLTHSAMRGVLDTADALVIVASPAIDAARSALATLDWLEHHGYADLVPKATVVLSSGRTGGVPIDLDQMSGHFTARVGGVFVIPYDEHLAEGGEITASLMNRKTRWQFMEVAAAVADAFAD